MVFLGLNKSKELYTFAYPFTLGWSSDTQSISPWFSERCDWTFKLYSSAIFPRLSNISSEQVGINLGVIIGFTNGDLLEYSFFINRIIN